MASIAIWQCVKTLYPFCSHQNSWDLWMFIPLKMVCIGIDPYPYVKLSEATLNHPVVIQYLACPIFGLSIRRRLERTPG